VTAGALTVSLAPSQVEALLWASAAASGGPRFPARLETVLGGAEARLLLALVHAADEETIEDDGPDPCCLRCGRRRSACRCCPACAPPAHGGSGPRVGDAADGPSNGGPTR